MMWAGRILANSATNVRLESLTCVKRSSIAPSGEQGQPSMRNVVAKLAAAYMFSCALATGACAEPIVFGGPTMGTTYRVRFVQPDAAAVAVEQLHNQVDALLKEVDQQMSTYREDSELSRFNSSPAGEWIPVSAATAHVVAAAQDISHKT